MTAKAHEISLEAGSKMAAAMKDVINAAAGITGFVLESARDLVQYMVRRGQMTQEEADKLIRQAEEAQANRGSTEPGVPSSFESVLAANDAEVEAEDDVIEGSDEDSEGTDRGSADSETGVEAGDSSDAGSAGKAATKHATGSKTGTAAKSKTAAKDEKPAAKKGASAPAAKKGTTKQK